MPDSNPVSLTELLAAAQRGDPEAQEEAARVVYAELHSLADAYLRRERDDHTLQATALVNEAYLRLLGQDSPWQNRTHFFGIAATIMRRILVDHARRATATRRDRALVISLDHEESSGARAEAAPDPVLDVLGVHEALAQLEQLDPRQARVVELKFFVGLSIDEIAQVVGISPATVTREWAMARVWLHARLSDR